jgi:hypothetical protein
MELENYEDFYKLLKNYTNVFYQNLLVNYINKPNYFEMLYVKGIFLLKNIYILLFFYCENINEVLLTSEKAYIYYIEFLIQINLNSMNLELTFRDAVLFTYKRTLLSYNKQSVNILKEKINKKLDTCLNILCNIFYLVNNRNFIEYNEEHVVDDTNYINLYVIKKINTIEHIENKLKKYIISNTNLSQFNNKLLQLRDALEKKIKCNLNNKDNKENNKMNNKINNKIETEIHYLLDNYEVNDTLSTNIDLYEFKLN